jgi:hypothetical protein
VKEKLERTQVADEETFFKSLQMILRGINRDELNNTFHAWVRRVQEVSEDNGDYVG